eukprot:CAMPEP_0204504102 /NCGR_PEP_ID=MMETSP0471-20130131/104818_1 /ASSEMBLY_ACC=CAM_ASM_000602 /TAXON_ID=2969 /ORGANISM="Oxyrrhis marina" /LENGTH=65 /DNA_ID=CAMNT_0051508959 /DNA_START=84 /DNA_END=281 /DNA_ORIENTATION=+
MNTFDGESGGAGPPPIDSNAFSRPDPPLSMLLSLRDRRRTVASSSTQRCSSHDLACSDLADGDKV